MSNATLERLSKERQGRVSFISELADQVDAEERDLVETELAAVKTAEERVAELDAQIEPLLSWEQRSAANEGLDSFLAGGGSKPRTPGREAPMETRSIGEAFTSSDAFQNYSGRGTSDTVHMDLDPMQTRAAEDPIFESTQPGKGMLPSSSELKVWRNERAALYPLLNYIGKMPTSATSIKWSVQHGATGAGKVAEGALKPFIEWTDEEATVAMETIAGVKKFSRQILADVPLFAAFLNAKLREALDKELDKEALTALNAGIKAGNTTTGAAGVDLLTLVRGAIGTLQARNVMANSIALNPVDHAAIDMQIMGGGGLGPQYNQGLFGVPVIPLPDITAGSAVVGNLNEAVTWFQHTGGVQVYVTDSDISGEGATTKSDFRRNILTSLIETRAAFLATDEKAIQKVVFTANP